MGINRRSFVKGAGLASLTGVGIAAHALAEEVPAQESWMPEKWDAEADAVIVDETDMDSDKVSIGCRVTVTNLDNGKTLPEYTIVGSQEANVMERKVSEDSPFGKAFLGAKVGDSVTVEAPRGAVVYTLKKIER